MSSFTKCKREHLHYSHCIEPHYVVDLLIAGLNLVAHPVYFKYAPVAQLDRVPDFESVGRRFESCRAHHIEPSGKILAQKCFAGSQAKI